MGNKKLKKKGIVCESEEDNNDEDKKKDHDDPHHYDENDKDKNTNNETDKYEDYDSVYAVDKECTSFNDHDHESVKTHNCTRKKCSFKCKRGYDHINITFAECKPNQQGGGSTWSNNERISCQPKY